MVGWVAVDSLETSGTIGAVASSRIVPPTVTSSHINLIIYHRSSGNVCSDRHEPVVGVAVGVPVAASKEPESSSVRPARRGQRMRTDYDTLVDDIAARADIGNLASAERAAIEVLLTFGERVSADDANALGVVLPGALGDAVTERADPHENLGAEAFVSRIAEREGIGVDEADALRHAMAVMATIAAHGGHDELRRARDSLPNEYDPLFETADIAP
jgi:uncharacterized protein (DUF2267 family)